MRRARRRPDDARPVTEDAVQRAIGFGRIATDAVRRRVVRHHDQRAQGVMTIVMMRGGRPHAERGQRNERGSGNRPCVRAEPLQHQTTRLTPAARCVKDRAAQTRARRRGRADAGALTRGKLLARARHVVG
jgi:hypothetical protein